MGSMSHRSNGVGRRHPAAGELVSLLLHRPAVEWSPEVELIHGYDWNPA